MSPLYSLPLEGATPGGGDYLFCYLQMLSPSPQSPPLKGGGVLGPRDIKDIPETRYWRRRGGLCHVLFIRKIIWIFAEVSTLASVLVPMDVEGPGGVQPLKGMGSEVIPLGLGQIGGQAGAAVGVEI